MGLLPTPQTATHAGPPPAHLLGRHQTRRMPTCAEWKVKTQSTKELFCLHDTAPTSCLHWCHMALRAVLTDIMRGSWPASDTTWRKVCKRICKRIPPTQTGSGPCFCMLALKGSSAVLSTATTLSVSMASERKMLQRVKTWRTPCCACN